MRRVRVLSSVRRSAQCVALKVFRSCLSPFRICRSCCTCSVCNECNVCNLPISVGVGVLLECLAHVVGQGQVASTHPRRVTVKVTPTVFVVGQCSYRNRSSPRRVTVKVTQTDVDGLLLHINSMGLFVRLSRNNARMRKYQSRPGYLQRLIKLVELVVRRERY